MSTNDVMALRTVHTSVRFNRHGKFKHADSAVHLPQKLILATKASNK